MTVPNHFETINGLVNGLGKGLGKGLWSKVYGTMATH